jgi:glycosyltransferase involved in cell wall biosynthesis
MKIGILSDTRMATVDSGSHGLGRLVIDLAKGLKAKGHEIILHAGQGSALDGVTIVTAQDEISRAAMLDTQSVDAWLDCSHTHQVSYEKPDFGKIVNFMMDWECKFRPPNTISGTEVMQSRYGGEIVRVGIDIDAIPHPVGLDGSAKARRFWMYAAKIHPQKGYDLALEFFQRLPRGEEFFFFGQLLTTENVPNWRGEIHEKARFYDLLHTAKALVHPARVDAGGRVLLEAAACGCPSIVLDWKTSGNASHVKDCVSGFICADVAEMLDAANDVQWLDAKKMREWVADEHSLAKMVDGVEKALNRVASGERW